MLTDPFPKSTCVVRSEDVVCVVLETANAVVVLEPLSAGLMVGAGPAPGSDGLYEGTRPRDRTLVGGMEVRGWNVVEETSQPLPRKPRPHTHWLD